ncbi:MAG: DUF6516 family protein [Tunicatimonas sp.]
MIAEYFLQVKNDLGKYAHLIMDFSTFEKTYSSKKGFIQGEVIFEDESKLHFAEVKDTTEERKIKYRYHYMDKNDTMIFRYDNASHYPELATFPHRKHTIQKVIETKEPNLDDVLTEIELIVIKNMR